MNPAASQIPVPDRCVWRYNDYWSCGIAFANIHQTPVAEILAICEASRHPIFSALLESGPLGLALAQHYR